MKKAFQLLDSPLPLIWAPIYQIVAVLDDVGSQMASFNDETNAKLIITTSE